MGYRILTLLVGGWLAVMTAACTNGPIVVTIPVPTSTPVFIPTADRPPLLPPAPATAGPRFGGVVFSEHISDDGMPSGTAAEFAGGTRQVWALSSYAGMPDGAAWRREWKHNGQVVSAVADTWQSGEMGVLAYPLSDPLGLAGGDYTFGLSIDGRLAQEASFTVAERPEASVGQRDAAEFGSIIFCADVTADGHPVNPTESFEGGASRVWAYFKVRSPDPTLPWRLLWERDGTVALDDRQDTRENENDGWFAYAIEDDNGLPTGHYTLTLFVANVPAQQATFEVTESVATPAPQQPAAFGPVVFAQAADAQNEAVDPAVEFEAGSPRVYASFFYRSMRRGQTWTREWLHDGTLLLRKDAQWELGADGVQAISLEDRNGLQPGKYTLNLYVDGHLARSANFAVREAPSPATDVPPSRAEDLIDRDLLPAWKILAASNSVTLRRLAQFPLTYHIPIRFGDLSAPATYRHSSTICRTEPGEVLVSRARWSQASWDEVAALLAHELTHAAQMLSAGYACDCSVEKEMQAITTEMFLLQVRGRKDLLQQNFSFAYDSRGKFSQPLLWAWVRKTDSSCKLKG
jgi:hypothetical protein